MTWKIFDSADEKKGYIHIASDDGGAICDIFPFAGVGGVGRDAALVNARKIVNAGQLHDALSGLLDWVKEGCPDGGRYAVTEAEAALANIRPLADARTKPRLTRDLGLGTDDAGD